MILYSGSSLAVWKEIKEVFTTATVNNGREFDMDAIHVGAPSANCEERIIHVQWAGFIQKGI